MTCESIQPCRDILPSAFQSVAKEHSTMRKVRREKILLLFCLVPFVYDFSLSVLKLLLSGNSYLSDLVRQSLINDNKIS